MSGGGQPQNPFSAQAVRPGKLPYQFAAGENAAAMVNRLEAAGWRGVIVGPHGAGKSTLLATLLPEVETRRGKVVHETLRNGQRRLEIPEATLAVLGASDLLVIDGYEQLSWLARGKLQRRRRRQKFGLLVTAHDDVRLPVLVHLSADLSLVQQLVQQLTSHRPGLITPDEVSAAFARQQGNVREIFFELYDLYEQRQAQRPSS